MRYNVDIFSGGMNTVLRQISKATTSSNKDLVSLYKKLYRRGDSLKFTDKTFYRKFVRRQFEAKLFTEDSDFAFKKAHVFFEEKVGKFI